MTFQVFFVLLLKPNQIYLLIQTFAVLRFSNIFFPLVNFLEMAPFYLTRNVDPDQRAL